MKARYTLLTFALLLAALANSLGQPTITVQPKSQTASLFADVTFRLTATSTQTLSFQWQFNEIPIDGAVTNSLTITNVLKTNAGPYAVVVSDASGSVTSQVATLTITPFNSIYCFGFSWTDTRGIGCGWPSPDHYNGRACNGPMWPEFLSTNLGLAYVPANNYAHCGATSLDVLNQVTSFPAPTKPQVSLYFLWAGDGEFFRAVPPAKGGGPDYLPVTNEIAWNQVIQTAILNSSNAVVRLYTKGAREIVIQAGEGGFNPGWARLIPINSFEWVKEAEYEARFHAGFFDAMKTFNRSRPDLRIISVDTSSKVDEVLANPASYGFTKSDIDALDDSSLTNKSFTGPGADYVFWDGFHVTSKFHELIAEWHFEALTNSILEKLDVTITGGSPNIQMNRLLIGRDYTLQSSTNLSNWQDIHPFTAAAGTNEWTGIIGDLGANYFRLKWQQ